MGKVKLADVAERAGVSKSTISQYLNGRFDYMSAKTRERIAAAIRELNYVPNFVARSLKTDRTYTIGVIVRDIAGFYTGHAIRGIDDFCKENGYNVLIHNTDFDPANEARSLQTLRQLNVDGVIITSSGKNEELISDYIAKELPIVRFQIEYLDAKQDIVVSDYRQAAFDATNYLLELGHERIGFLTQEFDDVFSRKERFEGYRTALHQRDIALDKGLIQYWDRESGFRYSPLAFLDMPTAPTALFSQHLAITIDLLAKLDEAQLTIPDDVSVMGFDDVPMAEFFKVPITVVKQEPYKIGSEAARLLLANIQTRQAAQKILVPCSIQKRRSCKALQNPASKR